MNNKYHTVSSHFVSSHDFHGEVKAFSSRNLWYKKVVSLLSGRFHTSIGNTPLGTELQSIEYLRPIILGLNHLHKVSCRALI